MKSTEAGKPASIPTFGRIDREHYGAMSDQVRKRSFDGPPLAAFMPRYLILRKRMSFRHAESVSSNGSIIDVSHSLTSFWYASIVTSESKSCQGVLAAVSNASQEGAACRVWTMPMRDSLVPIDEHATCT